MQKMQGLYNESYQPLGNLHLHFDHPAEPTAYERELDLDTACARVRYSTGGSHILREAFVSAPAQALVVRITSSVPAALNLRLALDSLLKSSTHSQGDTLTFTGKAPAHVVPNYIHSDRPVLEDPTPGSGMFFAATLRALTDGKVVPTATELHITGATTVTLLLTAATGFRAFDTPPDLPLANVVQKAASTLSSAAAIPYETLKAANIRDHQALFRRVSLILGPDLHDDLPTDERVTRFAASPTPSSSPSTSTSDAISSSPAPAPARSRPTFRASGASRSVPWSANWTANINVQMNYWLAETATSPISTRLSST